MLVEFCASRHYLLRDRVHLVLAYGFSLISSKRGRNSCKLLPFYYLSLDECGMFYDISVLKTNCEESCASGFWHSFLTNRKLICNNRDVTDC